MSATNVHSDCGTPLATPHRPDADFEIVFARYNLKALVMLLTDLEKAGLLEQTFTDLRADEEALQKVTSLVATLEEALKAYPE